MGGAEREKVQTRRFSGNTLIRAVMNHWKRKGKDTIYSQYYVYRRKMRKGWGRVGGGRECLGMMVLMVGGVNGSREVKGFSSFLSDKSSDESLKENRNKTAY